MRLTIKAGTATTYKNGIETTKNIYCQNVDELMEEFEKQKSEFKNPNVTEDEIMNFTEGVQNSKRIQKLGQYEDIEEELGIDLIKLIECIRNEKGIWKKDFDGGLINTRCMLACYFGRWQVYDKENIYDLKDYGKTWALTKEELQ